MQADCSLPVWNAIPASHILLLAVPFMFFSYKTINIDIAFAALLVSMNSSQSWKTGRRELIFSPDAAQTTGRIIRYDSLLSYMACGFN